MVKELDNSLEVGELEVQSCYYVQFQINSLGKGINPFISPAIMD